MSLFSQEQAAESGHSTLHNRIGAWLEGDKVIWMVTLILSLCSLLAVYSAISSLAYKTDGGSLRFLFKQAAMISMGWGVMLLVHKVNFRYFSRISQVLIWVAGILLILTLIFGADINDAKRWLRIPFVGLTLQTSDFAKVVLVTFVARELTQRRMQLHDFRNGVLPILVPIVVICGLILPADFSTAAMLALVCVGMLFIGGIPWKHLFRIAGFGVIGLVGLYGVGKTAPELLPRFGTWAGRIERFAATWTRDRNISKFPSPPLFRHDLRLHH
jgi:cell division protein FtsW